MTLRWIINRSIYLPIACEQRGSLVKQVRYDICSWSGRRNEKSTIIFFQITCSRLSRKLPVNEKCNCISNVLVPQSVIEKIVYIAECSHERSTELHAVQWACIHGPVFWMISHSHHVLESSWGFCIWYATEETHICAGHCIFLLLGNSFIFFLATVKRRAFWKLKKTGEQKKSKPFIFFLTEEYFRKNQIKLWIKWSVFVI